ncbi:MAG: type II secretion system F family protein [Gemmatimonadota bacterium]
MSGGAASRTVPVDASSNTSSVRWHYVAADSTGTVMSGEVDALSERDAIDTLRRRGLWATDISPVAGARRSAAARAEDSALERDTIDSGSALASRPPHSLTARLGASRFVAMVSGRTVRGELAIVVRAMATLLAAGVPLDRALAYAAGPSSSAELQATFARIRARTRAGDALSASVRDEPLLPSVFGPAVAAGEGSGTLDAALASLADHLERGEALRAKLRAALIYPAVLGVASVLGMTVILLVVVPRFAGLIADAGGTLPLSTRALIAISGVLTNWWWLLLGTGVLAVAAVRQWLAGHGNRERLHAARLGWPVVGHFERTRAAAGYTGVLALALRAGVSLLPAMVLARGMVSNRALAARLATAEETVRDGGTVAGALDSILPPLAVRLLDAGEASGDLAGMAARAADAAEAELQRSASGAVALIEPVLILGFGGVVGFVALALLQAIYGLNARVL